jgi:hypothetical protein
MKTIGGAVLALGLLGAALPASAQAVNDAQPESIKAFLEASGYKVGFEAARDDLGPSIHTRNDLIDATFDINFDACGAGGKDCALMTFQAGFSFTEGGVTLEELNEWNLGNFGKAVLDDKKVIWLAYEVNRAGGLTQDGLLNTLVWWENAMIDFVDYIGWSPE